MHRASIQRGEFTELDFIIDDYIDSLNLSTTDTGELAGCDTILSCLIYVLVKANIPEIPVYLSMISYFTLEQHQQDFEFMNTTLQAAIVFIR